MTPIRSRETWERIFSTVKDGHLGGFERNYQFSKTMFAKWERIGLLDGVARVLDIGCGNGRLAIPFSEMPDVDYLGVDPIPGCIEFCSKAFSPWSTRLKFVHVDLRNDRYNPTGQVDPVNYRFPTADRSVDLVVFSSVFTHVQTLEVAERYLEESARVLTPGGKIWSSWFLGKEHDSDSHRTRFTKDELKQLFENWRVRKIIKPNGTETQTQIVLQKPE